MSLRNPICAVAALAVPCLAAATPPALAQGAQTSPNGTFVRLDKLMARIEAVRYENVASNRPFVIIYATVRNDSKNPLLLAANTFDGTTLLVGSTVHGGVRYTFADGFELGQEGRFDSRTLGVSRTALVAFRYQLGAQVPTAPMQFTLRERPILKFPGQNVGGQTTFNVQGYVGAPVVAPTLPTPPQMPLYGGRLQTFRHPDASFRALGPLRARIDEVAYGTPADTKNTVDHVFVVATVQNTLSVPVMVRDEAFSGTIISEVGRSNVRSRVPNLANGTYHRSISLAPGEWLYVSASHELGSEGAVRAARRFSLSYSPFDQPGGTFTVDIPRFTALINPEPEARKQQAAAEPAAGGDFRKTAYMDVKLDRAARGKAGYEVTLVLRNMIGRRQGMQNDWQTYSLLGSDGVEYRADGNHYGNSGSEPLPATVWLENENEAKRTWLYPRFPAGVKPVSLIIREYSKEKARLALPG